MQKFFLIQFAESFVVPILRSMLVYLQRFKYFMTRHGVCPLPPSKKKKNHDCVCRLYAWEKAVGFTLNYAPRSYGYFFYCYFIFFFGCRWCVLKSVYSPLPFAHYSMHTHTRIYLLFIIVVGCCFHCFFFFFLDQQRCVVHAVWFQCTRPVSCRYWFSTQSYRIRAR